MYENFYISGNYAFVADYLGLEIIDISDPGSPQDTGYYTATNMAYDVHVHGCLAYVAYGTTGIVVLNVLDPGSPQSAGYYKTPGSAQGIFHSGDYCYVSDYYDGLQIYRYLGVGLEEQPIVNLTDFHVSARSSLSEGQVVINYSIPVICNVDIEIYNVSGQLIKTLENGLSQPGCYTVVWDGKDNYENSTPSGTYLLLFQKENFIATEKLLLMK